VLFCGETVDSFSVDQLLGKAAARILPKPASAVASPFQIDLNMPIDLKAQIEQIELERIQMALRHADGVISEAARMLTLKRTTLIEKMRKYRLEKTAA
jgi:sigma-54 specific flagellar transcriptional regulator A